MDNMEYATIEEPIINPNVNCQNCEDKGVFLDVDDQEWSCWCTEEIIF